MLESRTFGHMSSIFQGHSETTRLLFTTCLPRVASQPGGTPYRGAGGFSTNSHISFYYASFHKITKPPIFLTFRKFWVRGLRPPREMSKAT